MSFWVLKVAYTVEYSCFWQTSKSRL